MYEPRGYRAAMEVSDGVAEAPRAIGEAEAFSSGSRPMFEAGIAEGRKTLGKAAMKPEAVHRDYPRDEDEPRVHEHARGAQNRRRHDARTRPTPRMGVASAELSADPGSDRPARGCRRGLPFSGPGQRGGGRGGSAGKKAACGTADGV